MFSFFVQEQMSRPFWRLRFMAAGVEWKDAVAGTVLAALRQAVPVKTGKTRDSLSVRSSESPASVEIEFFGGGATDYLIYGTQPHMIEPLNSDVLHFTPASGEDVFAAWVSHPGAKQNEFHKRAYEKVKGDVVARFREAVISTMG